MGSAGTGKINSNVVWILIIALIVIFGVGAILEAALWAMLIIAAAVAVVALAVAGILDRV